MIPSKHIEIAVRFNAEVHTREPEEGYRVLDRMKLEHFRVLLREESYVASKAFEAALREKYLGVASLRNSGGGEKRGLKD